MTYIGSAALWIALVFSAYSAVAIILGLWKKSDSFLESGRRGIIAVTILLSLASLVLIYALLSRDFQVQYVADYTSRDLPLFYTLSAFWAGQAGSLLLWAWLLTLFALVVIIFNRKEFPDLIPHMSVILMAVEFFFLILLVFVSDPFTRLPFIPLDGQGLNPLLQNPGMFFHPPTLYLGYVGLTIPYALLISVMLVRRQGKDWIKLMRKWTLFAWLFLGIGIVIGGQWAYVELDWGGYWAWDPVENASLLPWLVGTAFLHSIMIQERRDMLKLWNVILVTLTFTLSIFGTFLTRSGILSSVHSFGESNLGPFFLAFIVISLLFSAFLTISRWEFLKSRNRLESFFSRESSFLFNNLILMGVAFAVFWGTIFPLVTEAVRGQKVTVGPPFFNQVVGPIFLILLVLTGICPLLNWRKTSFQSFVRNFALSITLALVFAIAGYVAGIRSLVPLLAFSLCVFVSISIFQEFVIDTWTRSRMTQDNPLRSLYFLMTRNKRRYGGYVVHLGIVLMFVGVIGSSFYQTSITTNMARQDILHVGRYQVQLQDISQAVSPKRLVVSAQMGIYVNGQQLATLYPTQMRDQVTEETHTEVAILPSLKEDLYLILLGVSESGLASIKAVVNPLVNWIWIGSMVLVLGTVFAMWPAKGGSQK